MAKARRIEFVTDGGTASTGAMELSAMELRGLRYVLEREGGWDRLIDLALRAATAQAVPPAPEPAAAPDPPLKLADKEN